MSLLESDPPTIEVDAAELTREEWFFLHAAFGTKPDASMRDINEWHQQSLGMPKATQLILFRQGLERLLVRGVIGHATDKEGRLQYDQSGEPIYEGRGRVISRIQHVVDPKKIIAH